MKLTQLSMTDKRDLSALRRIVRALDEVLVLTGDDTLLLAEPVVVAVSAIQSSVLQARYAAANAMVHLGDASAITEGPPHQVRRGD